MRSAVACILIVVATAAGADTIGPLDVEARESVGPMREGTYYEHRFVAFNPTAEPHTVRIEISGSMMGGQGEPRVSRTAVVAPRSAAMISLPQYIIFDYAITEANVVVDGADEGTLRLSGYSAPAVYRSSHDVLFGRYVPASIVTALVPDQALGVAHRPQIAPSSWSANWLHYTAFAGIVLTARDWNELPRPVHAALLRWVAAGGSLTFIGAAERLPQWRPANDYLPQLLAGNHGFGWLSIVPGEREITDAAQPIRSTWREADIDVRPMYYGGFQQTAVPVLEDAALPVKSLFSLLVVFAVVGGPVNMFVLAKKQRRLWIFWTLPVTAIVSTFILVAALIVSEGWVRIQKTLSLTLLDERMGEAATLGWTGFYATLSPEPDVRFDSATEVRPLFVAEDGHTDWTNGQRFVSGWIGSRLARGFALRNVESRRERLPVRREGGHLIAVNGLGAELKDVWVADESGAIHHAANVPAGKEVVLSPTGRVTDPHVRDPAHLFGGPMLWSSYTDRIAKNPRQVLRPGTYVAVVDRSPFLETAIPRPTKSTSRATIIGVMKGIDHAG